MICQKDAFTWTEIFQKSNTWGAILSLVLQCFPEDKNLSLEK
jgi:hypothetical protein